jgi:hypothetical protein
MGWPIVNVSISYYPIEILPSIYRYGYATPFYNVSRATRCIIFRTLRLAYASRFSVGLNFGVQLAWIGISLLTIPLFQWLVRRKHVKEWREKTKQQDADSEATQ